MMDFVNEKPREIQGNSNGEIQAPLYCADILKAIIKLKKMTVFSIDKCT